MSLDVIVLLIVLFVCFLIFRRLNRPKVKTSSVGHVSSSKINFATKQAIESQRLKQQVVKPVDVVNEQERLPPPQTLLDFSLLSYKDLTNVQAAEIENMLADFSKPHPLVLRLTSGIFDHKELSELIKSDPDITAKILTVVNSAQFSLQQPIKDINHAIIFLGVTQVKNIALQFAMRSDVALKLPAQTKAYQKIWSASYLASQLALQISKSIGKENASELSTLCLLLYLGDLVLLSAKPELAEVYLKQQGFLERLAATQELTNTNPAVVGYMLARMWQLPQTMAEDMRHQFKMLNNSLNNEKLDEEQSKDLMLCYAVCRLSDAVVFEGKPEALTFDSLNYEKSNRAEFYYLADNISAGRMAEIAKEIQTNSFHIKAKELIARALAA